MANEDSSKNDNANADPPNQDPPKENPPQQDPPQPDPPKEDPPQPDPPKEDPAQQDPPNQDPQAESNSPASESSSKVSTTSSTATNGGKSSTSKGSSGAGKNSSTTAIRKKMADNTVSNVKNEAKKKFISFVILFIILTILAIVAVTVGKFINIPFKDGDTIDLTSVFFGYMLVAILIERTVLVFVKLWRNAARGALAHAHSQAVSNAESLKCNADTLNSTAASLDNHLTKTRVSTTGGDAATNENINAEIEQLRSQMDTLASELTHDDAITSADADATEKKNELDSYDTTTTWWSAGVAFLFGVIVAIAGFRILAEIMDPEAVAAAGNTQQSLLSLIDIVLTGAAISGGSAGISSIIDTMSNFLGQGNNSGGTTSTTTK